VNEPAIVAEGLVKSFGDVHALAGVDLEVEEGSVFGFLGPNGAGKTTAIRILATLLRPMRAAQRSADTTSCASRERCGG
jgi:ABC-type multidrug transport system ATPase subunit